MTETAGQVFPPVHENSEARVSVHVMQHYLQQVAFSV